jgi:4'-phosphopantetheinyl transferase
VQFVEPLWQPLPLPSLATTGTEATEIALWLADMRELAPALEAAPSCLSAEEADQYGRATDPLLRRRRVHSRVLLRLLLGALLQRPSDSLQFVSGAHGKPAVVDSDLHFNLSHSQDLWLLAAAKGVSVGVDIEAPRSVPQWQRLSRRVFSAREHASLDITSSAAPAAFFIGWTRKEAVLKGLGQGFSFGASQLEAGLTIATDIVKFSVPVSVPVEESWCVSSLSPPIPCHAAVAWGSGSLKRFRTYRLTP